VVAVRLPWRDDESGERAPGRALPGVSVDVREDGWALDGLGQILTLVRSGRDPETAIGS